MNGRGPRKFPEGFLWGAATASHQVEGNNRWNDWWEFEQRGLLPHRSGEACNHYELYESDFDLARSWSHNAHRFSIEWSRIEPAEGDWNRDAIDHYARVLKALRDRGLEPVVTLHHFTNPAWFARRGGWTRRDSVGLFRRYAERVANALGDQVRYWLTINEPTVYVKRAYLAGDWPPCRRGAWLQAVTALVNMLRAHRAAYRILHRSRADAMVGLAHSAPYVVPCDPHRLADRMAASVRDFALNRLCFRVLGRTRRALDFIGINYYARQIVRWRPRGLRLLYGEECRDDHHGAPRRFSSPGWEVFAPGLRRVLQSYSTLGLPLIVTENGIATSDEAARSDFLTSHLAALAAAVADGIDVRGYFYWSLMDNFEWAEGLAAQFGLAAVDFSTQRRLPRAAAVSFAAVCRSNRLD